jgi:hypothetical protein
MSKMEGDAASDHSPQSGCKPILSIARADRANEHPATPGRKQSASSLGLMAGATPSAYLGSALTIQPYTAAELHPHTFPPSLFDTVPMLAAVTYVVVRENFRYCRTLHDAPTGERE